MTCKRERNRLRANKARRQNGENCAFIKLPGEIRNMIYDLVITDPTVHVFIRDIRPMKVVTRVCHAPHADANASSDISTASGLAATARFAHRHSRCVHSCEKYDRIGNSWYCVIMSLLLAHRTFYYDAKALPFFRSTFIFPSFEDFLAFNETLEPFQRGSLKRIIINNGRFIPPSLTNHYTVQQFPALEGLMVFYEAPKKRNPNASDRNYVGAIGRKLWKVLKKFRGGKVTNLAVCITNDGRGWLTVDPNLFGRLSTALATKVLAAN